MECCDGIGVIVFGEDWSLWVIAPFKLHFLRTPCLHDVVRWVLHLLGKVSFQNENACLVAAGIDYVLQRMWSYDLEIIYSIS